MKDLGTSKLKVSSIASEATYTVEQTDEVVFSTYSTTGTQVITIPTAILLSGRKLTIKDMAGGATVNNITIATEGIEQIDGEDAQVIVGNYDSVVMISDGSNWGIV